MNNIKKITFLSLLLAIAIILGIVDSYIPTNIPGVKLGLANIIIVMVLYLFSYKEAILINLIRIYISALLRGTIFSMGFLMSLSGGILSLLIMIILKYILKNKGIIFVSIIGAIFHSIGQNLIAIIYLDTINILYYLPILILISILTGFIMGLIAYKIVNNKTIIRKVEQINNNK